jgi:hypothetical protein
MADRAPSAFADESVMSGSRHNLEEFLVQRPLPCLNLLCRLALRKIE